MIITKKTKTKEILNKLEKEIQDIKTTEEYTNYLNLMSRFHKYSLNNQILITMQNPTATQVAGYNTWKKLGRQVRKGEKSIRILAPRPYKKEVEDENGNVEVNEGIYFVWVNVFDVSQTDGKELPKYDIETNEEDQNNFFKNLKRLCNQYNIDIEFDDIKAYGISHGGKITLQNDMSGSMKVSTALHEIAHEKLHGFIERMEYSKQQKELEAESVVYVVSDFFGLPQNSAKYLALFSGGYDLNKSLNVINKVSKDIISDIENTR